MSEMSNRRIIQTDLLVGLKDVSVSYVSDKVALNKVNLKIFSGEKIAVVGKNGSGKTTLGKLLAALVEPSDGEVVINQPACYLFQNPENQVVMPTVEREVAFGFENMAMDPKIMHEKVEGLLRAFGLFKKKSSNVEELSGGQLQRLAIASLVGLEYRLFFFDEPYAYLDPDSVRNVDDILNDLVDDGVTVMVVIHRPQYLEKFNYQRVLLFDRGRLEYDGPVGNFMRSRKLLAMAGWNGDFYFKFKK